MREREIADLSTLDEWAACGMDPRAAVGPHADCQPLTTELREAGYRGVLAPSAALAGAINPALFGTRYEKSRGLGTLDHDLERIGK